MTAKILHLNGWDAARAIDRLEGTLSRLMEAHDYSDAVPCMGGVKAELNLRLDEIAVQSPKWHAQYLAYFRGKRRP